MKRDLTARLAALAAGEQPQRRGHVLTPLQVEAVLAVAVAAGDHLVRRSDPQQNERNLFVDAPTPDRLPAPPSLVGVLP